MTMTDVPLEITEFDDFVHTTYLYKSKESNNKMLILKFVIKKLVLCTGAGGPEPEPEFCPILPELEPEFVHLRQNSGSIYLCCKLLS